MLPIVQQARLRHRDLSCVEERGPGLGGLEAECSRTLGCALLAPWAQAQLLALSWRARPAIPSSTACARGLASLARMEQGRASASCPDRLLLGPQGAAGEGEGPAATEGEAAEGAGGEEEKGKGEPGLWLPRGLP